MTSSDPLSLHSLRLSRRSSSSRKRAKAGLSRRSSSSTKRAKAGLSRSLLVIAIVLAGAVPRAQTPSPPRQVFRSGTELVLVNVVVRDKSGAIVRNLSRDDFTVTEDDKVQTVSSFDFEELAPSPADKNGAASAAQAAPSRAGERAPASAAQAPEILSPIATPVRSAQALADRSAPPKVDMRGRRLIVLCFDLSSMQHEELERAVKAAHDYVEQKLSPADLIAIASFSTSLQVVQDFSADRAQLAVGAEV